MKSVLRGATGERSALSTRLSKVEVEKKALNQRDRETTRGKSKKKKLCRFLARNGTHRLQSTLTALGERATLRTEIRESVEERDGD